MMNISRKTEYRPMIRDDMDSGNALRSVAALIYETDPYIYPALFGSKRNGIDVIPDMIVAGDTMFNINNIYVALEDNEIIGIILWHKGPMEWDENLLISSFKNKKISLPEHVPVVKEQYFDSYNNIDESTVSIINVCVKEVKRNQGVAQALLSSFINHTKDTCREYELFVLSDNTAAVKVYEKAGFRINTCLQGFSVENLELPCYQMVYRSDCQ